MGLSGFPPILGKMQPPPPLGGVRFFGWVGGWVGCGVQPSSAAAAVEVTTTVAAAESAFFWPEPQSPPMFIRGDWGRGMHGPRIMRAPCLFFVQVLYLTPLFCWVTAPMRCRVAELVPHFTLNALRAALYIVSLGLQVSNTTSLSGVQAGACVCHHSSSANERVWAPHSRDHLSMG